MALFVNYKKSLIMYVLHHVATTIRVYYKLYYNVYFQLCKFRAMIERKIKFQK